MYIDLGLLKAAWYDTYLGSAAVGIGGIVCLGYWVAYLIGALR